MGYWSWLGGLLLPPGTLLVPNMNLPGVSPGGLLDVILQSGKLGLYAPFWYLTMSPGGRRPMEYSLLGDEVSDKASDLVTKVSLLVCFWFGVLGSEVVSA